MMFNMSQELLEVHPTDKEATVCPMQRITHYFDAAEEGALGEDK